MAKTKKRKAELFVFFVFALTSLFARSATAAQEMDHVGGPLFRVELKEMEMWRNRMPTVGPSPTMRTGLFAAEMKVYNQTSQLMPLEVESAAILFSGCGENSGTNLSVRNKSKRDFSRAKKIELPPGVSEVVVSGNFRECGENQEAVLRLTLTVFGETVFLRNTGKTVHVRTAV